MTRYDILPAPQQALLPLLAPLKELGFVLYDGTAIALQIGHRQSIDFDFFSDGPLDRRKLADAAPFLWHSEVLQEDVDTWTVRVAAPDLPSVKLSFFTNLTFGRVGTPVLAERADLLLASLDDLLGHKLKVLLQRVEAKDYRDIAAMLDAGQSLEQGLGAAVALFPMLPPCDASRALVYFEGGDLASLSAAERATLIAHVRRIRAPLSVARLSDRLSL